MVKLTAVLVALITMFAHPALAAEWRFVEYDRSTVFLIDSASIITSGNTKSFWLAAVQATKKNGFDYTKTHNFINCREMQIGADYFVSYLKSGEATNTSKINLVYQPVIPGSAGESFANAVCHEKFISKPHERIDVDLARSFLKEIYSDKPKNK